MTRELTPNEEKLKARLEKALRNEDPLLFTKGRRLFSMLPSDPRCASCLAPFEGIGGNLVRTLLNKRRSSLNPLMCNACDELIRKLEYGAVVEMSMLFADIRGSTALAEKMTPTEFKGLIDRFYSETTHVLVHSWAVIDKLIGDEVSGYYFPAFAGQDFVSKCVQAAQELLRVTGHKDPEGPWASVGVGINTGEAYFGAVSSLDCLVEFTALGDAVNVAARLASKAATGEIIISESTAQKSGIDTANLEKRKLELKGKKDPIDAWILHAA
jgi:adenylate cyclase